MLQEILKQATVNQHEQLEQLMLVDKIMTGNLSVDEYKQILTTNYLIHAVYEEQLFNRLSSNLQAALAISNRYKLTALEKDLKELNIDFPALKIHQPDAVFLKNDAAILGALYVLEGATLGGNVIVKKLKVNANLQKHQLNFYYYQIYGADLIANWKQFCHILNTAVVANDYESSIQGALKLFDRFAEAHQKSIAQHQDQF